MRKILISLLLATITVCSAQTNHMKFMGIPMEGTLQSFTNQLKAKGYISISIQDGVSLLEGEFAGYKNCTIGAVADKSGLICMVSVFFPVKDRWGELEKCYNNYKSMLSEKYGEPSLCVERFDNSNTDDDNSKFYELRMDRCKYYSVFTCDNGDIQLEITHQSMKCFVMLSYFDNANKEKLRKQIMEDL